MPQQNRPGAQTPNQPSRILNQQPRTNYAQISPSGAGGPGSSAGSLVTPGLVLEREILNSPYLQHEIRQDQDRVWAQYWNARRRSPNQTAHPRQVDGRDHTRTIGVPVENYTMKTDPDRRPQPTVAVGFITPYGFYTWADPVNGVRIGWVPNPTLTQPLGISPVSTKDSGLVGGYRHQLDRGLTNTTMITNAEFAQSMAVQSSLIAELRRDPERWKDAMHSAQETKQAQAANQQGECAEVNADYASINCEEWLINVANENSWVPCASDAAYKSYNNAVWMVGQMYKQVYIPMAILLLLPGAIITQAKGMVSFGVTRSNDEDSINPFSGIIRASIAVFLIPATQLIVSYLIDVGNSLQYTVITNPYWDMALLLDWANEQTYTMSPDRHDNFIQFNADTNYTNPPPMRGKYANGPGMTTTSTSSESLVRYEQQNYLQSAATQWFNTLSNMLGDGLIILNGFQLIMICYLFLLGPVAASFFAWPSGIGANLFRRTFASWLDGVSILCLWKFWWCIGMLCAMIRLEEIGGWWPQSPWEMYMHAAFAALLMVVPFNPFEFKPGAVVDAVLEKAQAQVGKAGGVGAGGGGGAGGGSGAGTGESRSHAQPTEKGK